MLYLSSHNHLNARFAGTDYSGHTGRLDGLFVYSRVVLDLNAATGDAVVEIGDVTFAAESFQNFGSYASIMASVKNA